MPEEARIETTALFDNLPQLMSFVTEQARRLGAPWEKIGEVELVAEEALVNVISYAYPETPGPVHLRIYREKDRLAFEIRDQGRPFDATKREDPDLAADMENRTVGGLGIYFMKKIMSEVNYRRDNGDNVLTLILDLPESREG
ncbi:MAG: serine/threonine-protein kinase RsbW [Desulfovibrionales bacterium]|nr:serine/threonine-protein kinase RsbW [Desulfovibrionales bacterium]